MSVPFQFYAPIELAKSESDEMIFGGYVSSGSRDLEGEVLLQKGLNFDPFVERGYFNENHDQSLSAGGLVGVPLETDPIRWVKKGDKSPLTGDPLVRSGWFVMGQLLDTKEGRSIYEKAVALQKACTHRRLGMSLEGQVHERDPEDGKTVVKADIHNIALTQRPVNPDAVMEVLTKALKGELALITPHQAHDRNSHALLQVINGRLQRIEKALTAGAAIEGPDTATAGDGFALRQEDLEDYLRDVNYGGGSNDTDKGMITFGQARDEVMKRYPHLSPEQGESLTRTIFSSSVSGGH